MQLYAGLPVITNKVTLEEQKGIAHHLLGCIGLKEQPWVVGTFVERALQVIEEIRSRGRLPILVGGTHYYTQSLLFHDRLATNVNSDDEKLLQTSEVKTEHPELEQPTKVLFEELRRVDPVMAGRWHPNDRRKIQRSLEIFLKTGERASDVYAKQRARRVVADVSVEQEDQAGMRFPTLIFWVHAESKVLRERLDTRVVGMVEAGLLDEVRSLHSTARSASDLDESRGIWVSIGYKEYKAYAKALEDGEHDDVELAKLKAEGLERTQIATRQYAKRQIQWIRIKLANALATANATPKLYLLDGSEKSNFDQDVVVPALDLTQAFLQGVELPAPMSLSDTAAEMLTPKRAYDLSATPDRWFKRHCEDCGTTSVTEESWIVHTKSKSHKKLIRKALDPTPSLGPVQRHTLPPG